MDVVRDKRKEAVAEALGVHPKTVATWARAGCPHDREAARKPYVFDVAEVERWLEDQGRSTEPGRPSAGGPQKQRLTDAQTLLTEERAQLAKLKRQEEEGRLHDVEECRRERLGHLHVFKTELRSMPRSVAAELVGRGRAPIEAILLERIDAILRRLAGVYVD